MNRNARTWRIFLDCNAPALIPNSLMSKLAASSHLVQGFLPVSQRRSQSIRRKIMLNLMKASWDILSCATEFRSNLNLFIFLLAVEYCLLPNAALPLQIFLYLHSTSQSHLSDTANGTCDCDFTHTPEKRDLLPINCCYACSGDKQQCSLNLLYH